jgi:hypothetical protein
MKENVRRLPSIRLGRHEVSSKNRPFFDPVFSQVCKCAKARCTRAQTQLYKCAKRTQLAHFQIQKIRIKQGFGTLAHQNHSPACRAIVLLTSAEPPGRVSSSIARFTHVNLSRSTHSFNFASWRLGVRSAFSFRVFGVIRGLQFGRLTSRPSFAWCKTCASARIFRGLFKKATIF